MLRACSACCAAPPGWQRRRRRVSPFRHHRADQQRMTPDGIAGPRRDAGASPIGGAVAIAVVIPAHRQPGLLAEAVASVLAQEARAAARRRHRRRWLPLPGDARASPPPSPPPIRAGSSRCADPMAGSRPRATPASNSPSPPSRTCAPSTSWMPTTGCTRPSWHAPGGAGGGAARDRLGLPRLRHVRRAAQRLRRRTLVAARASQRQHLRGRQPGAPRRARPGAALRRELPQRLRGLGFLAAGRARPASAGSTCRMPASATAVAPRACWPRRTGSATALMEHAAREARRRALLAPPHPGAGGRGGAALRPASLRRAGGAAAARPRRRARSRCSAPPRPGRGCWMRWRRRLGRFPPRDPRLRRSRRAGAAPRRKARARAVLARRGGAACARPRRWWPSRWWRREGEEASLTRLPGPGAVEGAALLFVGQALLAATARRAEPGAAGERCAPARTRRQGSFAQTCPAHRCGASGWRCPADWARPPCRAARRSAA